MLKYIFLLILILTMVLIYFIKFKKNHLKSRKFNRTYKTLKQENNRSSTREIYQNITALINDRNFFAAEAQIHHALKQDKSQHELYLLLLDIYIFKNDTFASDQLLQLLRTLDQEEILNQVKSKLQEHLNHVDTIEFTPQQSSHAINRPTNSVHQPTTSETTVNLDKYSINFDTPEETMDHLEVLLAPSTHPIIPPPDADDIQTDEITLNFELAEKYIELGTYDKVRELLTEFEKIYTTEQRLRADQILKKIAS